MTSTSHVRANCTKSLYKSGTSNCPPVSNFYGGSTLPPLDSYTSTNNKRNQEVTSSYSVYLSRMFFCVCAADLSSLWWSVKCYLRKFKKYYTRSLYAVKLSTGQRSQQFDQRPICKESVKLVQKGSWNSTWHRTWVSKNCHHLLALATW